MIPQPVGVPPWPAGMLLLPEPTTEDEVTCRSALVAGMQPAVWPARYACVAHALAGHPDDAAQAVVGDEPWAVYDRALLTGDTETLTRLAGTGPLGGGPPDASAAAMAQVALCSHGAAAPPEPASTLPGEITAMVRSARASAALEAGHPDRATAELVAAAQAATDAGSPLLAGALRSSAAEILRDHLGDLDAALGQADAALAALGSGAPAERRAEVLLLRGVTRYHRAAGGGPDEPDEPNRALLQSAVSDLQGALQTYREDRHPELFAQASQYVALCYLVAPMPGQGERIRLAVAVSSLRAALRVLRPDSHPEEWASAQLNLANALQYLPSSHVEDNLAEAVELYEQLTVHRDPRTDPLGVARLYANQGNALAHLGILDRAQERLSQARDLFLRAGERSSAQAVDEVLAEIDRARAG